MRDYRDRIREYRKLEIETMEKLDVNALNLAMNLLEEAREKENTVYICGNGGSAATASHFVCDFNKGVSLEQDKKYKFVCLNDNIPIITAIANDISYHAVFEVQLHNKINAGDILVAVSGSGNSENVIRAAAYAKSQKAKIIGITGYSGGKIMELSDVSLHAPVNNMQITEDIHMMFDHMMMYILSDSDKELK